MTEHQHHDHLDVPAGDELEHNAAGDQLDQVPDDQLDVPPAGDGATTGDQDNAPAFSDPMPETEEEEEEDDVQALQETASQPNPYSPGYGVAGKFPTQDADAPADDER